FVVCAGIAHKSPAPSVGKRATQPATSLRRINAVHTQCNATKSPSPSLILNIGVIIVQTHASTVNGNSYRIGVSFEYADQRRQNDPYRRTGSGLSRRDSRGTLN